MRICREIRDCRYFALGAGGLLLTAAILLYLHHLGQRELLQRLTAQQELLTIQAARLAEQSLTEVGKNLKLLAADPRFRNHERALEKLEPLPGDFSGGLLTGLYLRDNHGNILSEYPPRLLSSSVPSHLLSGHTFSSRPDVAFFPENGFLFLAWPLPEKRGWELTAILSWEKFREIILGSLEKGQAHDIFLLDQGGRILSASKPGTGGRQGLVTYAPFQVGEGLWTLSLELPRVELDAIRQGTSLFPVALSIFLFCALLLLHRTPILLRRTASLQEEERLKGEEIALLRQAATLSERRFRQLLDNAGDAIFVIDPRSGAIQEVNRRTEELLGYTAQEIPSLSLATLFPGSQHRSYLRMVKQVLRDGYGEERNLQFRRKDGKLFTGEVHARLGELGNARVVHGIVRDVTEIRRIEMELRQNNRNLVLVNEIAHQAARSGDLRQMLQNILVRILGAFDADGGGIYLVREDGNLLRLMVHQGIDGKVLSEIDPIPPGEGLSGRAAVDGQPQTSIDIQRDRRFCSPAARQAGWRSLQAIPLASNEKIVGVLFLFHTRQRILTPGELDLLLAIGKQTGTAVAGAELLDALQWQVRLTRASNRELERSRRHLRENLARIEESNRTLERLERMKNNFLSLASHELRTPLTCILSGAELLDSRLEENLLGEDARLLKAIFDGGRRLEEIVRDLMEVARLESRSVYLAREPLDLTATIARIEGEFRPVLEERRLVLQSEGFPPSLIIFGDPHHLKKAFERLVENAVKFTPEGGRIEIRCSLRSSGDIRRKEPMLRSFSPEFFGTDLPDRFVQIAVIDSGIGIDPDEQVRIFDKFYEIGDITSHFTSRTQFGGKGVGLGLTLVKGMIEAHGGMVWVESPGTERKEGSAFHVLFPLPPKP